MADDIQFTRRNARKILLTGDHGTIFTTSLCADPDVVSGPVRTRVRRSNRGLPHDAVQEIFDKGICEVRGQWFVRDEQAVVAGTPQLIDGNFTIHVFGQLVLFLGPA